jgi:23S rRNA (pseudouridine1915-N3)-methyltransferase
MASAWVLQQPSSSAGDDPVWSVSHPSVLNPSRIRVLAVGKVRKRWIQEGLAMYLKRLPGLIITELKDSTPQREAEAITAQLRADEQLVVLSEEGELVGSVAFAERLQGTGSDRLAFVIGGADGLDPALKARASRTLSLSPLTFPHELARLLLLEQLYRALTIQQGGAYHRS